jgi:hypothetical protein
MITTSGSDAVSLALPAVAKLPVVLDAKGRVRVSKEQRQVILAEFERSGEAMPAFARRSGLKYSTLAAWVAHRRSSRRPARKTPLRLLEAVLPTPDSETLWLHLPGGARLELRQSSQVALAAALVQALNKAC